MLAKQSFRRCSSKNSKNEYTFRLDLDLLYPLRQEIEQLRDPGFFEVDNEEGTVDCHLSSSFSSSSSLPRALRWDLAQGSHDF